MDVLAESCIWSINVPSRWNKGSDLTLSKIRKKMADGSEVSTMDLRYDEKRPFYITKPGCRDHKQKRIYEYEDNLDEYMCTQTELASAVHRALLGYAPQNPRLRDVADSPYLYGTDVSVSSIVKNEYMEKFPDYKPTANLAVIDYETDVVHYDPSVQRIIAGAYSDDKSWLLVVDKNWLGDEVDDPFTKLKKIKKQYVDPRLKRVNTDVELELLLVDGEYDIPKALYDRARANNPDYVGYWNIGFDIKAMLQACVRKKMATDGIHSEGFLVDVGPKAIRDVIKYARDQINGIFCDPRIPEEYHFFNFIEAEKQKRKSNGDVVSKDLIDLWHKITSTSTFQHVCLMAFFRLNRLMSESKRPSYSQDAILKDELDFGKLKFDGMVPQDGLNWHVAMQMDHKLNYAMYCQFDTSGPLELDKKTMDISVSLGEYCGVTDLISVSSNPKRLADDGHFFLRSQGRVICATGTSMFTELDDLLPSKEGWIITLPAERVWKTGRSIVYGIPDSMSRISLHCGDIDVESSYPTTGSVLNDSSATIRIEVCSIEGFDAKAFREIAVNMTSIEANGVEICRKLYGMPTLTNLSDIIREKRKREGKYVKEN